MCVSKAVVEISVKKKSILEQQLEQRSKRNVFALGLKVGAVIVLIICCCGSMMGFAWYKLIKKDEQGHIPIESETQSQQP